VINMEQTTAAQIAELAEAIRAQDWRPQYLRLGEDGQSKIVDGWAASVWEAAWSGRAFMVKARADIVAIDNDNSDEVTVWEFLDEYPTYLDLLPVVSGSGGEGRSHLLARIEDPVEREGFIRDAKGFGFRDVQAGRWIRPPMSPHPAGGASRLVNMDASQAVAALRVTSDLPGPLGAKAKVALFLGPSTATSKDASSVLMAVTLGMVANGWSDEKVMFDILMRYPGGASLHRRMEKDGWSKERAFEWWQQHTLAKARERVAASPTIRSKSDVRPTLAGLKAWMAVHQWKGTGGSTDVLVLGHLLGLAIEHGRVRSIGASVRQVAEQVGVSHPTALRSLRHLHQLGVIRREPREDAENLNGYEGPLANRYAITVPPFSSEVEERAWREGSMKPSSVWEMNQSDPGGCENVRLVHLPHNISAAHDAFRHGALSKAKYRVLSLLGEEPLSARQVSNLLGRAKGAPLSGTYGHLRVLTDLGLATKVEGGWVVGDLDLDVIAEQFGTTGKAERQRVEHNKSRDRAQKAYKQKHGRLLAGEEFADRLITASSDGLMVSDKEVREHYFRFLLSLGKHRGPKRKNSWAGIDPWDEVQARWPEARHFYVGNTGMWSGIRLIPRRNLPHLPVIEEIPIRQS